MMQILYRIMLSNWNLSMMTGGCGHTGHILYLKMCPILEVSSFQRLPTTLQGRADELAARSVSQNWS